MSAIFREEKDFMMNLPAAFRLAAQSCLPGNERERDRSLYECQSDNFFLIAVGGFGRRLISCNPENQRGSRSLNIL